MIHPFENRRLHHSFKRKPKSNRNNCVVIILDYITWHSLLQTAIHEAISDKNCVITQSLITDIPVAYDCKGMIMAALYSRQLKPWKE